MYVYALLEALEIISCYELKESYSDLGCVYEFEWARLIPNVIIGVGARLKNFWMVNFRFWNFKFQVVLRFVSKQVPF